jgi:hypothetical protein
LSPKLLGSSFLLRGKTSNDEGSCMGWHAGLSNTQDSNRKWLKQIHTSFTDRFYIFAAYRMNLDG